MAFEVASQKRFYCNMSSTQVSLYMCLSDLLIYVTNKILCFIITGMTVDKLVIDAAKVFSPGQLGVAISRVTDPNRLRVKNYNKRKCPRQPTECIEFYNQPPLQYRESLECCRQTGKEMSHNNKM